MNLHVRTPRQDRERDELFRSVIAGLTGSPKTLPCKYFYDELGSQLFEEITTLPEYYPTRTEIALLERHAGEIAQLVPPGAAVVEFGSGSSTKTEVLLRTLRAPRAYLPLEISPSALYPAAERIVSRFPGLTVYPLLAGFSDIPRLSLPQFSHAVLGFFPGSTIGNFAREEAIAFLSDTRRLLGDRAFFLIGADLKKPLDILLPAYDDAKGVTAAFNLNILRRINRELGANFQLGNFRHEAIYNEEAGRIEMHLRSLTDQTVTVGQRKVAFTKGETIHTENSHKYTIEEFRELAEKGGWRIEKSWHDADRLFSVHLMI
jgi:dimethylhistidine N-methyltransferase